MQKIYQNLIEKANIDNIERYVVGGIIYNGKYLLLERKSNDFMGGILELPSGKVEQNETLYNAFAEDNDIKNIITDLIELAKPYDGLSATDLRFAIDENLNKIRRFRQKQEQEKIRQTYKHIDDDDVQAVQIQIELKERLKNRLRTGENN